MGILQGNILINRDIQQPHDGKLVQSIQYGIVRLAVTVLAREQPQHGLHTVAPFQPSGGEAVGAIGNAGIIPNTSLLTLP